MEINFLTNKYSIWYYSIINNAQKRSISGYVEKHHILPRSLGGNNDASNIVNLSAREHFVCHLLLTKITTGEDQIKMQHAVGKFAQVAPGQRRIFTSWEYKKIRESISKARTGKKHSTDAIQKMSAARKGKTPWNKGLTSIVHSEESNAKRSATMTGKKKPAGFGQKLSESKKGHKSGMTGKKHSVETLQKIRQAALNRKQKIQEK